MNREPPKLVRMNQRKIQLWCRDMIIERMGRNAINQCVPNPIGAIQTSEVDVKQQQKTPLTATEMALVKPVVKPEMTAPVKPEMMVHPLIAVVKPEAIKMETNDDEVALVVQNYRIVILHIPANEIMLKRGQIIRYKCPYAGCPIKSKMK